MSNILVQDIDLTTYEASKKLISAVKKHPILYDTTMETYKENDLKVEIWEQIAEEIIGVKNEVALDMVKSRWRNLRWNCKKSFVAYKLKKQRGFEGKPFRFAKEMAFLIPHYRKDKRTRHLDSDTEENWRAMLTEERDTVPFKDVTRVDVEILIQTMKKYPILLDEKKRGAGKPYAWKKITVELCGKSDSDSVQAVKVKWKNMKYRFLKAMEDYRYKVSNGIISELQKPAFYDELSFLLEETKDNDTKHHEVSIPMQETSNDEDDDPLEQLRFNSSQGQFIHCKEELIEHDDEVKGENHHASIAHSSDPRASDDIDAFFLTMGRMVKKMKPINKILIKKTIMNLVLDMELREAREAGHS